MKKCIASLVLLICLGYSASAQTEKGTKLIGGTGNLHINTDDNPNDGTSVTLLPRVGVFVANNLALGVGVPLQFVSTDWYNTTSVGLAPFVRGYFGSSATRLLLEGRVGFNYYKHEYDSPYGYDDSDENFGYSVGAGAVHFLNEHVGLELILSYDKSHVGGGNYLINNFNGINLNLGLQIHLPRKQ